MLGAADGRMSKVKIFVEGVSLVIWSVSASKQMVLGGDYHVKQPKDRNTTEWISAHVRPER